MSLGLGPPAREWRDCPLANSAAAATLALGIGSSVALFNLVDAVLLRPLPYPAADKLVAV